MSPSCRATRSGDQMLCQCGLAWDVTDPEPPDCPEEEFDLPAVDGLEESAGRLAELANIWNVLGAPDKNRNPRGMHQHHDALLAENARLQRIIAQALAVPDLGPNGGYRPVIRRILKEADEHG